MKIEELLHESNVIEGFDDPRFDFQAKVAWEYIQAHNRLSIYHINRVQKILTIKQDLQPDWRGYLRKQPVYIGGHEAMKHEFIKVSLQEWIKIEPDMDPIHAHVLYEAIHPHIDGNGRTGRILLWWRQEKLEQPFTEITDEDKWEYYQWFKAGSAR